MKATIYLKDGNPDYISVKAEEMHEDGEYLKVYAEHSELTAIIMLSEIKSAYITESKGEKRC